MPPPLSPASPRRTSRRAGATAARAARASLEVVGDTLRGPVIDVFLNNVPPLKGLGREQAFDLIIGNTRLVEECFHLFHKRPELFHHLLVGLDGKPVTDENQPLLCGRSLAEVVALIVRAAARRHFLARFPPEVVAHEPTPPERPMWTRLLGGWRRSTPPAPQPRRRRKATRGDRLYMALREFLLYEWQLPLIPHYTPLPVAMVRRLGPRILHYRAPHELKTLLAEGLPPDPPADDLAAGPAESGAPPPGGAVRSGGRLPAGGAPASTAKTEAMWKVAEAERLPELFGVDDGDMRQVIAEVSRVAGPVIGAFSAAGLKMRETVVVLVTLHRRLGPEGMRTHFGRGANMKQVTQFSDQLRREGVAHMRKASSIRATVIAILARVPPIFS